MSHVLAAIPARYGSNRLPGKLMQKIHGKTLLQHTFENTCKAHCFDKIIIATDSEEIRQHVIDFGGEVAMTSSSCLTGTDRIAEAVESHPEYGSYDIVFNVQGDEPNVESHVFEQILDRLEMDTEAVMSTAVVPFRSEEEARSYSSPKCVLDRHQRALYFSRALIPSSKEGDIFRSDITYYQHLGIYAYRRSFLFEYARLPPSPLQLAECLEQLRILENGYKIAVAIVESEAFGVNTAEDLKNMEKLGKRDFTR